ncbi:FAD-dependent oxidoreductase domain-containing protein 1-like [Pararge aegeria]|uniref:FAD-dependent oxidoreductase domain-containing protein 1 n=3 Tax=Pararge aegeria TaxID=116150 RepID=A0A8S4RWD3_9NEOP|nr:FAD-dependent oxidoreductase domain-containing protein 1-like [Pararge aegeria]CAH2243105.1 jg14401 [Pararge aegeria aegeria]
MILSRSFLRNIKRNIHLSERHYVKHHNPFVKTWNTLFQDLKSGLNVKSPVYPEHADVVIIGGGFIGASAAFWLKTRAGEGLSVVVLEKDPLYTNTQKMLSHGIMTQHFTLPENIYLSQFSAEFFRNIKEHLGDDIDIEYCPLGQLLLASDKYVEKLEQNVNAQNDYGIRNKLLTVEEIQRRYPWINTSDVKLGCIGTESEGVFNAKELLRGYLQKSKELGANYINSEMVGFEMEVQRDLLMEGITPGSFQKINRLLYKSEDGEIHSLKFAACIVAGGTESVNICKLAKIGESKGLLKDQLPIEKREYNIYSIETAKSGMPVGLNAPLVMDTSGLWLRRNGLQSNLLCGQIPSIKKDSGYSDTDIFQASLLNRYPHFKDAEVNLVSTEIIDCNTYDETGIIGPHPYHSNLVIASGFGRQGVQHSPGIGRAVAELVIDCHYNNIDLIRYGFDRLLTNDPLIETNMY